MPFSTGFERRLTIFTPRDLRRDLDKKTCTNGFLLEYLSTMSKHRNSTKDSPANTAAERVFRDAGGILRTRDALQAGIHPRTLYALRDQGRIEQLSRGLFRLANQPPLGQPDLVTVAMKIPSGVICLISALAWHELTTQIPHEIYVAISRGSEPPRIDYPPVRHYWFSGKAYTEGVETHKTDGATIRIYSKEKTLADCFKHRNRIGMDTVLEALKTYFQNGEKNIDELMRFADICRVTKVITPYLEAML